MPNYAVATIIGHAGRDAEQKGEVAKISLGVSRTQKGEKKTTWWSIVAFGKTAELLMRIKKGEAVGFTGEPSLDSYTNRDGVVKESLQLVAREIIFLGGNGQRSEPKREQPAQAAFDPNGDIPGLDDVPFVYQE